MNPALWALFSSRIISYHCKQMTDKKHQLSDWRIRPLTPEMVEYARKDTHYLAYITKALLERLAEQTEVGELENAMQAINSTCQSLALRKYKKPPVFSEKYFKRLKVLEANCTQTQVNVFTELWVC